MSLPVLLAALLPILLIAFAVFMHVRRRRMEKKVSRVLRAKGTEGFRWAKFDELPEDVARAYEEGSMTHNQMAVLLKACGHDVSEMEPFKSERKS